MNKRLSLIQLSPCDGEDIYEMLQRIGMNENSFKNTAHGLTYIEFKEWLIEQDAWSRGVLLPETYVAQTVFWLFDCNVPVGYGKIRHSLNDFSRNNGGNIGFAIDPLQRGKGYATILLHELIIKADELGVLEKLLTVDKGNIASRKVIEKNGGILVKENEYRWYYSIR